jgi:hypothetical protein
MDPRRKVPKWTHYQLPVDDAIPFVISTSGHPELLLMFEPDPGRHRVAVHLTREQLLYLAMVAESCINELPVSAVYVGGARHGEVVSPAYVHGVLSGTVPPDDDGEADLRARMDALDRAALMEDEL